MLQELIKKVSIPVSELPTLPQGENYYYFRLRIVSDDLNDSSEWSPIYKLSKDGKSISLL